MVFIRAETLLLKLPPCYMSYQVCHILSHVGIPQPLCNNEEGQRKQKVVLTTRSEGVCSRMEVDATIKVECLEPKEASQLFRAAVGKKITADPEIETLVEDVAYECGGLPIALKAIGKAMSNKKTVYQWRDALSKLQSHTGAIRDVDVVYSRLKISYDSLEDETEKECFLYCSLWPEDYIIEEEELIWCWLGHGLIDLELFETIEAAFDRGHSIIENLKEACLLEESRHWSSEKAVKMHDVMRDMAIQVVGEKGRKWVVKTVKIEEEANQAVAQWEGADKAHIEIRYPNWQTPRYCGNLSTLIFTVSIFSDPYLDTQFLHFLPALRYLDLTYQEGKDKELPADLGSLSNLEYLRCRCVGRITGLPDQLENLSKLKYLFISSMWSFFQISNKLIIKLPKVLLLDVDHGVLQNSEDPTTDYDVEHFYVALQRLKAVSVGELKILSLKALERLSHIVKAQSLVISNLEIKDFQLLSNRMGQTEKLNITDCVALEKLLIDSYCVPTLRYLRLSNLPMMREIIWSGIRPETSCTSVGSS